ncbi:ATP-dependent DNA ligase [Haloquadratum walsbyi]|uniref:DNA ligase n=1 Tax=Haloquadratum walsbyi J07HQW2 TaxID=1238425 RepID=U1MVQ8_9EURY|nr:ATP-dependent DNA ligase [Haloquadratum walsbyi]ERG94484.1 MAG: DNA ligase I, ATP-dependent, dnl1 [Haloquadratum walsbyi J07HQW2]
MQYRELTEVYTDVAATSATTEKEILLADCFSRVHDETSLLPTVVRLVRGRVFARWEAAEIGVSTAGAASAINKATGVDSEQIETWWREEGDLGDAAAYAVDDRVQRTLTTTPLTVTRVYETLREVASYEGSGSQQKQIDEIAGLISDASPLTARYIVRTITGAMRLGVGEGIVRNSLARAFLDMSDDAADAVQRAIDLTNDVAVVAQRVAEQGRPGLDDVDLELFRPIKPMLAKQAESIQTAVDELAADLEAIGDTNNTESSPRKAVLVEFKYDGIRAKIHRNGDDIRVYTRRLSDVTTQFPDVVSAAREHIDAEQYIIEAELVGYDPQHDNDGPVTFQTLAQRIQRTEDIAATAESIPVTAHVFDLLALDGESLLEDELEMRLRRLNSIITTESVSQTELEPDPTIESTSSRSTLMTGTNNTESLSSLRRAQYNWVTTHTAATEFYDTALAAGHEGVMVKNPARPYQPGSRVGYQRKVKPMMEPLDLVVTRAKWSEGRKSDFLGRPYLACRTADDDFVEVGRMHTGFSDEQLATFTERVEPLIERVDGREAILTPTVVLEVEYEEIQTSSTYDSGYALRFPRLKQIRHDCDPSQADSLERVERLYEQQSVDES